MDEETKNRREALLTEYGEVANLFRTLTDIRFKLLTVLPIASAATVAVGAVKEIGLGPIAVISLFGLVVTIGTFVYNERNNQLYNELVGRAAAIERNVGLPGGAFANRPRAWLTIKLLGVSCKIDHGTGMAAIYGATVALWLFGIYYSVIAAIGLHLLDLSRPQPWIAPAALILTTVSTYIAAKTIQQQKRHSERRLRELAAGAVENALFLNLARAAEDARFLEQCAYLGGTNTETVRSRARFYASLDRASLQHYMPLAPEKLSMSHFVALLTDLPPLWIFDCATNRRGARRGM